MSIKKGKIKNGKNNLKIKENNFFNDENNYNNDFLCECKDINISLKPTKLKKSPKKFNLNSMTSTKDEEPKKTIYNKNNCDGEEYDSDLHSNLSNLSKIMNKNIEKIYKKNKYMSVDEDNFIYYNVNWKKIKSISKKLIEIENRLNCNDNKYILEESNNSNSNLNNNTISNLNNDNNSKNNNNINFLSLKNIKKNNKKSRNKKNYFDSSDEEEKSGKYTCCFFTCK